ncbi:MAG TPA: FecR domain-containing protein [Puia sp.]|jgi:ferric-dicitrate binding protein FerR (iron transport regulator)
MTSRIEQLMKLCMQEEASEAERNELLRLLQAAENEGEAKSLIREVLEGVQDNGRDMGESVSAAVLEAIFQADAGQEGEVGIVLGRKGKMNRVVWRRMAYAAAVVLLIAAGMVVALVKKKPAPVRVMAPRQNIVIVRDIPPGGNKAILTLADGATISLDDCKKGDIARDGNAQIVKGGDSGTLIYHAVSGNQQAVAYNTITTPRGGQYQLALSDGSKVWLNASSSLHFPTTFGGKDRSVELTGEGYFEIARNTAMPFSISVNGVRVQVLGTHLNINAYHDERVVRTTLIEGAVKVESEGQAVLLRPGQQAVAAGEKAVAGGAERSLKLDPEPDLEEVMAWKEGIFNFKNLDIESIMRQISRWYDVEVVYEGGKKPEGHFSGMISRNTPALTVLKMLEYGGVHFTIESKKIVIGNQ